MTVTAKVTRYTGSNDFSATAIVDGAANEEGLSDAGLAFLYINRPNDNIGDPVSVLTDLSGNGNHGVLFGNSSSPVQRAEGLESTNRHGFGFITPVRQTKSFTHIVCAWPETLYADANDLAADMQINLMANSLSLATDLTANQPGATWFAAQIKAFANGSTKNRMQLRTPSADVSDPNPSSSSYGDADSGPWLFSIRVNGETGEMSIMSVDGYKEDVTDADIIPIYATPAGYIVVGSIYAGTARPEADQSVVNNMYSAGHYVRWVPDQELLAAMVTIQTAVNALGHTVMVD